MKIATIMTAAMLASLAFAEPASYALKFDATVKTFDENGKATGTAKLKAGTRFVLMEDVSSDSKETKSEKATTSMSPIVFKNEKPTKPVEFKCDIKLDDSYCGSFEDQKSKYHSTSLFLYTKSGNSLECFVGYVEKTSLVGKKLYGILSDGDEHKGYVTVKYRPNEENDYCVEIVGFKPEQKKASGDTSDDPK